MDVYLKKMGLDPADSFKNFDGSLSSSHSSKSASDSDSSTSEAPSSTSDDEDETEFKSDRSASGSSSSEVGQGGAQRRKWNALAFPLLLKVQTEGVMGKSLTIIMQIMGDLLLGVKQ